MELISELFKLRELSEIRGFDLEKNHRYKDAIQLYKKVYQIDIVSSNATTNHVAKRLANELMVKIGICYKHLNKIEKAIAAFKTSMSFGKNDLSFNELGHLYAGLDRNTESVFNYKESLKLVFNYDIYMCLILRYDIMRKRRRVIEMYEFLIKRAPSAIAYSNLACQYAYIFMKKEAKEMYKKSFDMDFNSVSATNYMLGSMYINTSPADRFAVACRYSDKFETPYRELCITNEKNYAMFYSKPENVESIIRIGYISNDFHQHPVGYMMTGILQSHDMNKFRIYCYNTFKHDLSKDYITRRIKDVNKLILRDVSKMDDDEIYAQIQKDQINILVECMGHTGNHKLMVCARKPAPIIVDYFAYPSTTGIKAIDYKLTDKYCTPEGLVDEYYSEKLYRLDHGIQNYYPPTYVGNVLKRVKSYTDGHIRFCCFNNPAKYTELTIQTWARILNEYQNSTIYLCYSDYNDSFVSTNLINMFIKNGVDRSRIHTTSMNNKDSIEYYNIMDIALDSFPYNGGTITVEALWMGTPIIVLEGDDYYSRVGVSLMTHLGLPELIAKNVDEYVAIAVGLASDTRRLRVYHKILRDKMKSSALGNRKMFTLSIEKAYINMWEIYKLNLNNKE